MLKFDTGPALRRGYMSLWREHKRSFGAFATFDLTARKIIDGSFLVLRRQFVLETVALLRDGRPVMMGTVFLPREGVALPGSLGMVVCAADLRAEEASEFWSEVARRWQGLVTPLNGHHYLGFALARAEADSARVGFQTASPHAQREAMVPPGARGYRQYVSLETALSDTLITRMRDELADFPAGFRVRGFELFRARRDFDLLNGLVNQCFGSHFDFSPLTDDENWEIMGASSLLLRSGHLLFLEHEGRTVGFVLGMRDYNRALIAGEGDVSNFARALWPRRWDRARSVHIGILPEYRGQKLVKYMRHQMLLNFAAEGVRTVESSYVDEGNGNSLGNVRSTGAELLHTFDLFRV